MDLDILNYPHPVAAVPRRMTLEHQFTVGVVYAALINARNGLNPQALEVGIDRINVDAVDGASRKLSSADVRVVDTWGRNPDVVKIGKGV